MEKIQIWTLLLITAASIFIVAWLFRPGAKAQYDKFGKIPLKEEKIVKKVVNGRKKTKVSKGRKPAKKARK